MNTNRRASRNSKPTLSSLGVAGLSVLLLSGCVGQEWPAPIAVDLAEFQAEHEVWRTARQASLLAPPGGPVLWIGLWDLPQGETKFGSDPTLPIVLPSNDAPLQVGTLRRSGQVVEFEPAVGAGVTIYQGRSVTELTILENDRHDDPTRLALGSLGLRVHSEPGTDRLWLRGWDESFPGAETFELPDYFPIDPTWSLPARFDAYPDPVVLTFPDVTGGTIEYVARGELVFRKDQREHRLIATAGETSSAYQVIMWDSTATSSTYQGGRYVRVQFPDDSGWTTIDFNRAYNAPCVFTAYSVCGLPTRPNWLTLPITAGEMRPTKESAGHP
jgi:uncharacterized protein (DUF1684 family)